MYLLLWASLVLGRKLVRGRSTLVGSTRINDRMMFVLSFFSLRFPYGVLRETDFIPDHTQALEPVKSESATPGPSATVQDSTSTSASASPGPGSMPPPPVPSKAQPQAQAQTFSSSSTNEPFEPEFDPDEFASDDEDDVGPSPFNEPGNEFPTTHELVLKDHTKVVSSLALDPSGARVLSGSHDYDCKLWDFGGMDARCRPFKSWEPAGSYHVRAPLSRYSGLWRCYLLLTDESMRRFMI